MSLLCRYVHNTDTQALKHIQDIIMCIHRFCTSYTFLQLNAGLQEGSGGMMLFSQPSTSCLVPMGLLCGKDYKLTDPFLFF